MEQEYKYMVCTHCFTYNHAPYIVDAMNGFTMQETTFPVVTLIVDDASTDGEPEVIRQYLIEHFQEPFRIEETEYAHIICAHHKTNPNCQFVVFLLKYNHYSIKKPKLPYLSKWNGATKYIALCEGDDYWIDTLKLQKQVNFLEANSDYALSYTRCNHLVQETGELSMGPSYLYKGFKELLKRNHIGTLTVVIRKDVYDNFYEEINPAQHKWPMGDYPIWLYVAANHNIYYLSDITSVYRIHQGSASRPSNFDNKLKFLKGYAAVQHFFAEKYNMPNNVVAAIDYKANYNMALAHINIRKYIDAFPFINQLSFKDVCKCVWHMLMTLIN